MVEDGEEGWGRLSGRGEVMGEMCVLCGREDGLCRG